jgi:riboflavin biosynthesis pyrimidine reductase
MSIAYTSYVLLLSLLLFLASCDAAQVNTANNHVGHQPRISSSNTTADEKIKNNATAISADDQTVATNNITTALENKTVVPNSDENITRKEEDEEDDPIDSILSDISSWMKTQQSNNAAQIDEHLFGPPSEQPRILRRPFITLAYAQTLDGMIAAKLPNKTTTTTNMKISSPKSLLLTHKLRNMHDAILVGGSTFEIDEPRLNSRLPKLTTTASLQQPMPIVLDTHLRHLQQILFNTTFPSDSTTLFDDDDDEEETTTIIPTEMSVERIRANNPIICCSKKAAFSFLDLLEIFQDHHLQQRKKRSKTSYKIIVYKKIDENDHIEDACMPIKITVHVTHHNKNKKEEDVTQEVTFTLLPCPINERTNSVSLKHAMCQLCDQFEIRSIMVEGGAGILSSFLNEYGGGGGGDDDDDDDDEDNIVRCICVTIAPTVLGGFGLPSLGGLDALMKVKGEKDDEEVPTLKRIDGKFIPLGRDCVFLGRL